MRLLSDSKKYLPLLAVVFSLFLLGVGSSDEGLRDVINPNTVEDTRSSDKEIIDMFGGENCGDGLVQQNEDCDPPGLVEEGGVGAGACSSNKVQVKECSQDCQWKKTCKPGSICGNGVVEASAGEKCDDGDLNGTYGNCADGCNGPFIKSCGNGSLDTTDQNNNPLEVCDTVNGVCTGPNGETADKREPCSIYATSSLNSCASDCQSRGNYCGDGVRQQAFEECDDGNNNDEDKCRNDCTVNEEQVSGEPRCGNGIVDDNETCDEGDENGQRCTPNYGESCTYCSNDCQNILTVDSGDFCGNSNIDQFGTNNSGRPIFERCDINNKGETLAPVGYWAGGDKGWVTTQIALVLDLSGSIDYSRLKNNLNKLVEKQKNAAIAVVAYQGTRKNPNQVRIELPFSADINTVKSALGNLNANGGYEQVYQALDLTSGLDWKEGTKKGIILVVDEEVDGSYGEDINEQCDYIEDKADSLIGQDITFYTVTDNDNSQACSQELENDIPTNSDGDNFNLNESWNNHLEDISRDIGSKQATKVECPDKGSYNCTNQCRALEDNCVECVKYNKKDSVPYIATLNPLIVGNEDNYYDTSGGGDEEARWGAGEGGSLSSYDQYVVSYRINPPSQNDRNTAKYRADWGPVLGYTKLARQPKGSNISGNRKPSEFKPLWISYNASPSRNRTGWSLESDKLCQNEYGILFSPNYITNNNDKNYVQQDNHPKGDVFSYPVGGESGKIKNSYVTSPAVPPSTMRVVVEWTDKESREFSNQGGLSLRGKFTGALYSQRISSGNSRVKYSPNDPLQLICNDMTTNTINNSDYWYPTGCNPYTASSTNMFVHEIGGTDDFSKNVQSMTIENLDLMLEEDGEQAAFYVKPIGSSIQPFQDGNLKVSIYTYHENQEPLHSIYKPTYQFEIKEATTSQNPRAPYWHAFNIMNVNCKGQDTWAIANRNNEIITPGHSDHGKIITRSKDIKKTTKVQTSDYDCSKLSNLDYYNAYTQGNFSYSAISTSGGSGGNNYWSVYGNNIFLDSNLFMNINVNSN